MLKLKLQYIGHLMQRANSFEKTLKLVKIEGKRALDIRRGPQGPALVASGKAIPHACCSGPSRDTCPIDAGV